jgi:hypothetical protein
VHVDQGLGTVIGAPEGAMVSYAEIQKGLHKYIHDHGLRTDVQKPAPASNIQASEPETHGGEARGFYCISCGEGIPSGAVYCDLCGAPQ